MFSISSITTSSLQDSATYTVGLVVVSAATIEITQILSVCGENHL